MTADPRLASSAFDDFVRSHERGLLRLAVLMVISRSDAEDVVQDALAALAARWDDVADPLPFARATVVNRCRMLLRHRDTVRRKVHLLASTDRVTPSPTADLADALAALPEAERIALVLRFYVDLPDDRIADVLGCRPATVRSHVKRGLARLRRSLT